MIELSMNATFAQRYNLSYQHMEEAIYMARMSEKCEIDNKGKIFSDGDHWCHSRSYVVGSIMISVACIEAKINEFYADWFDKYNNFRIYTSREYLVSKEFIECWNILFVEKNKDKQGSVEETILTAYNKSRNEILKKYQVALLSIVKRKFDISQNPYQDMQNLIILRNMLTHFRSEWSYNLDEYKKLEDKLRGKFETSPFYKGEFFPFGCLSSDCAKWAVQSSMNFIFEFFRLIELDIRSDHYNIWKKLKDSIF